MRSEVLSRTTSQAMVIETCQFVLSICFSLTVLCNCPTVDFIRKEWGFDDECPMEREHRLNTLKEEKNGMVFNFLGEYLAFLIVSLLSFCW